LNSPDIYFIPPFVSPVQLPANCAFEPPLTQIEKHIDGKLMGPPLGIRSMASTLQWCRASGQRPPRRSSAINRRRLNLAAHYRYRLRCSSGSPLQRTTCRGPLRRQNPSGVAAPSGSTRRICASAVPTKTTSPIATQHESSNSLSAIAVHSQSEDRRQS